MGQKRRKKRMSPEKRDALLKKVASWLGIVFLVILGAKSGNPPVHERVRCWMVGIYGALIQKTDRAIDIADESISSAPQQITELVDLYVAIPIANRIPPMDSLNVASYFAKGSFKKGMKQAIRDVLKEQGYVEVAKKLGKDETITGIEGDVVIPRKYWVTQRGNWNKEEVYAKITQKVKGTKGVQAKLDYIEDHKGMAMELSKERPAIPPGIRLTIGILESNAGRSRLARNANNHHGIKAKMTEEGGRLLKEKQEYLLTDAHFRPGAHAHSVYQNGDENDWCRFNVYDSAEGSYRGNESVIWHSSRSLEEGEVLRYRPGFLNIRITPIEAQIYDITTFVTQKWVVDDMEKRKKTYGTKYDEQPIDIEDYFDKQTFVNYFAYIAMVLKAGGYATSGLYHKKLVAIYFTYELWRIDYDFVMNMNELEKKKYYGIKQQNS